MNNVEYEVEHIYVLLLKLIIFKQLASRWEFGNYNQYFTY